MRRADYVGFTVYPQSTHFHCVRTIPVPVNGTMSPEQTPLAFVRLDFLHWGYLRIRGMISFFSGMQPPLMLMGSLPDEQQSACDRVIVATNPHDGGGRAVGEWLSCAFPCEERDRG